MRTTAVLVVLFVGCGPSQVAPALTTPPSPPSASATTARAEPIASAAPMPSTSASSEPVASPVDAAILEAATTHRNVAVVHVRDHHDFVATVPAPAKHPSVTLDVLRWLKGPSHHPDAVELRIEKSDPELKNGGVYLMVFDSGFDGKAVPSLLQGVLAKEMAESDSTVEALATALGAPSPTKDDICRRAWFDLRSVPAQCHAKGAREATQGAFTVRVVPASPRVRAGDELALTVEVVNTSKQDAILAFQPGCAELEPEAWRGGKRADWVNESCGFGRGCGGPSARLTISPGGKAEARVVLRTNVRKVQKSDCSEVVAGPLPEGTYELRVSSSPFFPLAEDIGKARAKVDVTK